MKIDRTRLLGKDPIIPEVCKGPGVEGLVSVIIPTYNRGYIIDKAIESVLTQTYEPFELIVVDDGSNDDTMAVIKKYGNKVQYIYQKNTGLAAARNTGLSAASGEFIAFQDSDDIWLPWKLQLQTALLRNLPELAIVWTDMVAVTPDGKTVRKKHLRSMYAAYDRFKIEEHLSKSGLMRDIADVPMVLGDVIYRYGNIFGPMFFGNLVHPPTALIRRRHLQMAGGLDLTFAWTCEDYEFFWRVAKYGMGAIIEASSILYRVDAMDQLTKPNLLLYVARGNLLALKRRLKKDRPLLKLDSKILKNQLSEAYNWVANEEVKSSRGRWINALRSFLYSFALNPWKLKIHGFTMARILLPNTIIKTISSLRRRKMAANNSILSKILAPLPLAYSSLKYFTIEMFS